MQEISSSAADSGQSSQQTIPYTGVPSPENSDSVSPATPPQRAALPVPAPINLYSSGPALPACAMPAPDPVVLPGVALPAGTQHVPASVQARAAPAQQAAAAPVPFMPWRSGQHLPASEVEESLPQRPPRGPRSSVGTGVLKTSTKSMRPAPRCPRVEHQVAPRPHQKAPQTEQLADALDLPTSDKLPGAVVSPKTADMDSSQLDAQGDAQQIVTGKTTDLRSTADTKQGSKAGVLERTQPAEKEMRQRKKGARKAHQQEVHAHPELPAGDGDVSGPAGPAAAGKGDDRKVQRRRSSLQQLGRQSPPARSKAVTMHADSPIHGVVLPERPQSAPSKGALAGKGRTVPQRQEGQQTDMSKQDDSQSRMTARLPKDGTSGELVPHKTSAGSGNADLASVLSGLSSSSTPNDVGLLKEDFETAAEPKISAWRPKGGAAEDAASRPQSGQSNTATVVWEPVKQPPWVKLEGRKTPVSGSQPQQTNKAGNPDTPASPSTADTVPELNPLQAQDGGDSDPGSSTSQVYIRAGAFFPTMYTCSVIITAVASCAAHHPTPSLV